MTKVAYYRHLARCLAAMAARYRWMKQDVNHELWHSRAMTAFHMMRLALDGNEPDLLPPDNLGKRFRSSPRAADDSSTHRP